MEREHGSEPFWSLCDDGSALADSSACRPERDPHRSGSRNPWRFVVRGILHCLASGCLATISASGIAEEPKLFVRQPEGPVYFWSEDLVITVAVSQLPTDSTEAKFRLFRRAGAIAAQVGEGAVSIPAGIAPGSGLSIPVAIPEPATPSTLLIHLSFPGSEAKMTLPITILPPNYLGDQLARIGIAQISTPEPGRGPWARWLGRGAVREALPTVSLRGGWHLIAGPRDWAQSARGSGHAVLVCPRAPDDARVALTARQAGADWIVSVPAEWQTREMLTPTQQYDILQLLTEILTEPTP